MKYLVLSLLIASTQGIQLKNVDDFGIKTATKVGESINPATVYKEDKDALP